MLDCKQTAALLRDWDKILVLSHQSPDGDTLGCAAALLRGLVQLGKQVTFRCADELARKYQGLFEGLPLGDFVPEHIVSVDVAEEKLLGSLQEEFGGRVELAIDHHSSHRPFARESWVEGDSAAAAEMIWLLLQELGVQIDRKMAECIYTGITTDTGCFRYRNTTPRTHRIAAEIMEMGVDTAAVNQLHFETKSLAQFAAEQMELASLEIFGEGKCTLIREPLEIFTQTGARPEDLDGSVAAMSRQIEGVLLGVMLKERENGDIKVSVRANPPANASVLCAKLGGGGHPGAAGCTLTGVSMEEAARQMKAACLAYLQENQL